MLTPLRVLFIEDSEADTEIVLQELQAGAYEPQHQRVDNAVLLQLALQRQTWDLIICDYLLPSFNAPEALKIVKSTGLDVPFIVLSGMIGEDVAVEMMRAGAHDCLFKGHLKRLLPAIDRELREAKIRLAKRQAEASALQLAAIVESCEDAIISTDLKGRIVTWNLGAERLYGYQAAEAMGRSLVRLIQPSASVFPSPAHSTWVDRVIDCQQVTQRRKTGELIEVLLTVSLLKNSDGEVVGFAMIGRDISERQRVQQMKDEFISVINHELRTPLTSLQGSVELLLTGKLGELSPQGVRMLEIAANNIDRIVKLTSTILDLEGLSTGKIALQKQPCDIDLLLKQTLDRLQSLARKHQIQFVVRSQSIQLVLDPLRIEQVLEQLLMNAIQFSRPGGRVWLEITLAPPDQLFHAGRSLMLAEPAKHSHAVLITVQDEGPGISSDQLEAIWFFQNCRGCH
ncbi:MAG: PAS domain S-box protein [Elainella sp.]